MRTRVPIGNRDSYGIGCSISFADVIALRCARKFRGSTHVSGLIDGTHEHALGIVLQRDRRRGSEYDARRPAAAPPPTPAAARSHEPPSRTLSARGRDL